MKIRLVKNLILSKLLDKPTKARTAVLLHSLLTTTTGEKLDCIDFIKAPENKL